jgi:hypothetical protein
MKTHWNHILATSLWLGTLASAFAQTTFTKVTIGPIATEQGQFVRPVWGDFRNSGFQDLVIANYGGRTNVFYRNNGNGSFTKIIEGNPVAVGDYHVGVDIGDYDNDGDFPVRGLACHQLSEPVLPGLGSLDASHRHSNQERMRKMQQPTYGGFDYLRNGPLCR